MIEGTLRRSTPVEATSGDFLCEVFDPNSPTNSLEEVALGILAVDVAAFGWEWEGNRNFRTTLRDKNNTFIILRDSDGRIVAYCYAHSISVMDKSRTDDDTVYIPSVAVLPTLQGRGLSKKTLDSLVESLRTKGYEDAEIDVLIKRGFADSLQRHFGERVLETEDHKRGGGYRHMRIRLAD